MTSSNSGGKWARRIALVVMAGVALVAVACTSGGSEASHEVTANDVMVRLAPSGTATAADLAAAAVVVDKRLVALHLDPNARASGHSIVLGIPKSSDRDSVVAVLVDPGELEFRPVVEEFTDPATAPALTDTATVEAGDTVVLGTSPSAEAGDHRYRVGPASLGNAAIESASYGRQADDEWSVRPLLSKGAAGIGAFNRLTRRCNERDVTCAAGAVAIVFDQTVLSAPVIEVPSFSRDQIALEGSLTELRAGTLAVALNSGSLPIELRPVS